MHDTKLIRSARSLPRISQLTCVHSAASAGFANLRKHTRERSDEPVGIVFCCPRFIAVHTINLPGTLSSLLARAVFIMEVRTLCDVWVGGCFQAQSYFTLDNGKANIRAADFLVLIVGILIPIFF